MALPEYHPVIPIDEYQQVFRQGSLDIADHINTLESSGRSGRAAREALDSSLHTLNEMSDYNKQWIEQNIPAEYKKGWDQAFQSNLYATPTGLGGGYGESTFAQMHREAIEQLAYGMKDTTDLALAQVGRQVADHYRNVGMSEALRRQFTGETIRQTTKRMRGRLEGLGLTTFGDAAGRQWGLDSYCTMVARTTTREATTQGTLLRAQRMGYKRIALSEHYPTCPLCAPLQGRVYTTDPRDQEYPQWMPDYCPVHPNCLHTIYVYIERYDPNRLGTKAKANRAWTNNQTAAQNAHYKSMQAANMKRRNLQNQYSRYLSRLGQDKVGTIQGFARSKAAGSGRYQELQTAYRAAGRQRIVASKTPIGAFEQPMGTPFKFGQSPGVSGVPNFKTSAEAKAWIQKNTGVKNIANLTGDLVQDQRIAIEIKRFQDAFPNFTMKKGTHFGVSPDAPGGNRMFGWYESKTGNVYLNAERFSGDVGKQLDYANVFAQSLDRTKHFPVGTNPMSIVNHELTHVMEYHHGLDAVGIRRTALRRAKVKTANIRENLSSYAQTTPQEFIAEGISEALTSVNPRPVAREVLKLLQEAMQ